MKSIQASSVFLQNSFFHRIPQPSRRAYWATIGLAALACGGAASAQTNSAPGNSASTNAVLPTAASTNVTTLRETTVTGHLDVARSQIMTSTGASDYSITKEQIAAIPQGENAGFNQVLLRTPGIAEDSLGQLHLRGEHANIQYRINDVILPEGITGFGQELDTRFVQSIQLMTGSLPAEYGFRTAGVVDLQTKSGAFDQGGQGTIYGGSFDTISPSFEYGGSEGKLNYFFDGSYIHNDLGIENPTASYNAIHDATDQYKTFGFMSYVIDDTSRITGMASVSYGKFQIPIDTTLTPGSPANDPNPGTYNPSDLDDHQVEQNYYAVAAYQKSVGDLNFQVAAFARESAAHYVPEAIGPVLYFNNGVASEVDRTLYSGGLQADGSYVINDQHTLRGGFSFLDEYVSADSETTVFPLVGGVPMAPQQTIAQDGVSHAYFTGFYLQDEWKILPRVTLNYGGRFDIYNSSTDHENQFSPRVNGVYKATDTTTLHAGYSHYFTPPPLENVSAGNVAAFNNTTGASTITQANPVLSERADYVDAGVTQEILPGWTVGVDGYYKWAKNQLDDGFFGQSLVLSAFNYNEGRIEGLEFTTSYTKDGFSTYGNVALGKAQGRGAATAQFLWADQTVLNYVNDHYISLDHDQRITVSTGASYLFKEGGSSTRVFVDALYGSGLRENGGLIPGVNPNGDAVPNGASVPSYYSLNLGVEQDIKLTRKQHVKARIDVINVTDNIYQLRSGSGVGVNAPQYGERRGVFASVSYIF